MTKRPPYEGKMHIDMPPGGKAKPDDQKQAKRIEKTAKDLGVDLDDASLAKTLRRIARREFEKKKPADE
jgi:hypothetical protein